MKKKKILIILLLILITPKIVLANDKITLTNRIAKTTNPTDLKITYTLLASDENELGAINEPKEIEIDFKNAIIEEDSIKAQVDIDFSTVEYEKAGIYRYILFQKELSDKKSFLENKKKFFLYVQVNNDEEGNKIKEIGELAFDSKRNEKSELEYINETNFTNIRIKNQVQGLLKDYDKNTYFKYKVSINSLPNSKYTILGQDEWINYEGESIKTEDTYTVKDTKEENYTYIYLKDNQEATIGLKANGIKEIPIGIEYTITKINGERWETTIGDAQDTEKSFITKEEENICIIINKRDYDNAMTGWFVNIIPYIVLLSILVLGIIIFKKSMK